MRLTNGIRDEMLEKLVDKAFPKQDGGKMEEELGVLLSKLPLIQERKKIYDKYSNFTLFPSEYVSVEMKDENGYLRCTVKLPIKYATEVSKRWEDLTFSYEELEEGELKDKVQEFLLYIKKRDEFRTKTRSILYSVNSSTKLLELLPEALK